MLSIRHYVDIKILKSIYHAIFEPHLSYASLFWVQNSIYTFYRKNHSGCFFITDMLTLVPFLKNLKFTDKVALEKTVH